MRAEKQRTFADAPAVRAATPLWVGLVGPSGSGKTYSGLRLATGMQRVSGGEIFVIDTEARRALHYADAFKFNHVPFEAPFSPDDYLAAVEHCIARGAKTILIDSASHLWEGPGGVLEWHEAECERLVTQWRSTREKVQMSAWQRPKSSLRRLLITMLTKPVNFILCLRAKEKLRIVKGEDPKARGWQPIGPDELTYELTLKCLLLPGSDGVPTWQPDHDDEKLLVKLPTQFRSMFGKNAVQLSEDVGEQLARWAAGAAPPSSADFVDRYAQCADMVGYRQLEQARLAAWKTATPDQKTAWRTAAEAALARISKPARDPVPTDSNDDGSVPGL